MLSQRTRRLIAWAAIAALAWSSVDGAQALVIVPGDGDLSSNVVRPADDPGWDNVGDAAIYVGNRWVLSVAHLVPGAVNFGGTFYARSADPVVRIKNPTGMGLTQDTDLVMYRLATDPALPALVIADSTPAVGAEVVMIGDGNSVAPPSAAEIGWRVDVDSNDVATWVEGGANPNYFGYRANAVGLKMWGNNHVADDGEVDPDHNTEFNLGQGDVIAFSVTFDKSGVTAGSVASDEAQGLADDSGSAVFQKVAGVWQLAGVTDAIDAYNGQPQVGSTAVFGNATYFVDLSFYRDQILAVTIPEAGGVRLGGAALIAGGSAAALRRRRTCAIRREG